MFLRQFIIGFVFLVASSFALSNDEFTYNIIEGSIEVTGYWGSRPSDLVIPDTIDGYSVTRIGFMAFQDEGFTSVTIPNSVTSIGHYAFKNNKLTSITLPNSVQSIGWDAFKNNQLVSINIPDSVLSIGGYAFQNNKLVSVTLPDSIISIGRNAFEHNKITSINLPASITSIEDYTFNDNQLDIVIIPNSVTSIGRNAFGWNNITSVTISDSVTSIGSWAFQQNQFASIVIPNSVTSIQGFAFSYNPSLTSATFLGDRPKFLDWSDGRPEIDPSIFTFSNVSNIFYCLGKAGWPGNTINGITPQLNETCDTQNDQSEPIQYATFDIDQNGSFDALTDGLILLRYAFGLRGDSLISGATASDATRTSASKIEEHIQSYLP